MKLNGPKLTDLNDYVHCRFHWPPQILGSYALVALLEAEQRDPALERGGS